MSKVFMSKFSVSLGLSIIALMYSSLTAASPYRTYYDEAQVVDVRPIKTRVRIPDQQESCWYETARVQRRSTSYTPPILGALAGGVLGNQVGGGNGKTVATIAGTLLGASVARDMQTSQPSTRAVTQRRCQIIDHGYVTEERIDGYEVDYQYDGEIYSIQTQYPPRGTIRVKVNQSVEPVGHL